VQPLDSNRLSYRLSKDSVCLLEESEDGKAVTERDAIFSELGYLGESIR
jgi:hypothetical protein